MWTIPHDTIVRQQRASAPGSSAWVSANAGSGKTHVLAQRVVRLLLEGVPPARILCLTFTKAGAATMSNRVFRDLAAWTALDDASLAAAILDTGAASPNATDLEFARQLFARAIETPGGLKIQTIHAFCERLLHLFPFEANVPARFEVLEELAGSDLLLRARESALAEALADPHSGSAEAVAVLSARTTSDSFDQLVREALGHRDAVRGAARHATSLAELTARMGQALGHEPGDSVTIIERMTLEDGLPADQWEDIGRRIGADDGSADRTGNRLLAVLRAGPDERYDAYVDVFMTQMLKPRANQYLSQGVRRSEPTLCAELDRERDRVASLVERRKAVLAAEGTAALVVVAGLILDHYDRAKRRRGLLDYEDLIERTRTLLKRSDAAWVLYKLDRGIDHILIDEAQDTSPEQWEILEAISADFFAGEGRPAAQRTFFAVGDEKQSIYSFQGARPDMFATMKARFARRIAEADRSFADIKLLLSFRSAPAVLDTVDRIFRHPAHAAGLTADTDGPPPHEALKTLPGLVELWPPMVAPPAAEPRDWRLPVDVVDPNEPPVILARRIAEAIGRWTAPGSHETVEDGRTRTRRPMRPGDILILVRSRSAFFNAMIRALKERRIPVAGADRLALTDHIAVMDLIAAGWTALSPDDDFTLACVLKSPLIGLGDDDLIRLAPRRSGSLLMALEASDQLWDRTAAGTLAQWRHRAATLTPFGFYSRLLSADGGRRALLGRLGPEAGDAVDEFLALSLAHEREGAPSLLAFLARLDGAELSVKRDMETAGDAVRVMTVHAAKGLEAKVVILPDTCTVPNGRHDPRLFRLGDADDMAAPILWSPKGDADPARLGEARKVARERALEEHNRLFYVALTRAEERLYVAGFCGDAGPPDRCWYAMIEAAGLDWDEAPAFWNPDERIRRRCDAPVGSPAAIAVSDAQAPGHVAVPNWLTRPPASEPAAVEPPIRPSNPLGAADQFAPVAWSFGDRHRSSRQDAMTAGRLMHKLLQHLPAVEPERRRQAGQRALDAQGTRLPDDHRARLLDQALAVIEDPQLRALFGPQSKAEVAVAGTIRLPSGRLIEIAGQMDRIGVTEDAVHLADYKTGRPAKELTSRHVLQLALYRVALLPLYPGKPIRAYLVWTSEPRVVEIDGPRLDRALADMH